MSLVIEIPEPLATQVVAKAHSQGRSPTELVLDSVAVNVVPLAGIDAILAPMRARLVALGITEEEAVEDFEREKHAMRAERRAAGL